MGLLGKNCGKGEIVGGRTAEGRVGGSLIFESDTIRSRWIGDCLDVSIDEAR